LIITQHVASKEYQLKMKNTSVHTHLNITLPEL